MILTAQFMWRRALGTLNIDAFNDCWLTFERSIRKLPVFQTINVILSMWLNWDLQHGPERRKI